MTIFVKYKMLNYNIAMKRFFIQVFVIISMISVIPHNFVYCVPVPQMSSQKQEYNKIQDTTPDKAKEKKNNIHTDKKAAPKPIKEKAAVTATPKAENTKITHDKFDSYEDIRNHAKLLYNANQSEEALKLYNAIPDSEKVSDDWLILANISQDKDKIVDAVFYLKKSIQADDKNYKAHYNLGNLYYYDKKYNMALNEYRKVLRIKKDFAYAYYNKGCCYLKKNSWFNAKYEFGLAIKANPDEPSFYYNLAYTYKMMKKDKKAKEALDVYNKLMTQ